MPFIYLFICLIIYLQQKAESFWEVRCFSCSQGFSYILLNPKVYFLIHNCPPTVPMLSHLDSAQTATSHFLKIHINSILPFTLEFLKCKIPIRFPHQKAV